MKESSSEYFENTAEVLRSLATDPPEELDQLVEAILDAWDEGGKVVSCGNGGSASDSQHFTTELVARFNDHPIHKPALSLAVNPSTITAVANDWSYEDVFARQVEAQVDPRDVLIGISTSGRSKNIIRALEKAEDIGTTCFGLTGMTPGELDRTECTIISVPSDRTPHIQEAHAACLHYVCQCLDNRING